ncbi:MAG TPA: SBBP repeat-containing protein [bacterium]|nr:SBBP repeat-containing protein [bacterium]
MNDDTLAFSDDFLASDEDAVPDAEPFWDFRIDRADRDLLAGMLPTADGGVIIAVKNEDTFVGLNGALLIRYNSDLSERWSYCWPDIYVAPIGLAYGPDPSKVIVSGRNSNTFYLAAFNAEEGTLLWERSWKYDWQVALVNSQDELGTLAVGANGIFVTGFSASWPEGGAASYTRIYVAKTDFEGKLIWEKIYGNGGDMGGYIALDGEGNIYITGYTVSGLGDQHNAGKVGDCAGLPFGPAETSSCPDPYLMKLDGEGNMLWARQWGSATANPFDWGVSVVTDVENSVYALSLFAHAQWGDSTIRKYDPDGALLWEYRGATSFYFDRSIRLHLDDSGILWAVGDGGTRKQEARHPELMVFDADTGRRLKKNLYGPLSEEKNAYFSFADMVETNGKLLVAANEMWVSPDTGESFNDLVFKWMDYFYEEPPSYKDEACAGESYTVRQFGTDGEDIPVAVAESHDGTTVMVGNTEGAFPGRSASGLGDIFVTKRKEDGSAAWTVQFGTADNDIAAAAVVDGTGNIFVTGHTYGHFAHSWWRHSDPDVFLAKISPDGTVAWIEQMRTEDEDYATALAMTGAGNILMFGHTRGSLDGLPKDETECHDKVNADLFLAEWTPKGEVAWLKQWGGDKDDVSAGMTLDAEGSLFITGYTQSELEGNTLIGGLKYFGEPFPGAFASKRTPLGEKVWTQVWQKENGVTDADANETRSGEYLIIKTDGTVVVAGTGAGVFLDPSSEEYTISPCYPSQRCQDIFVSALSPEGILISTRFVGTLLVEELKGMALHEDVVSVFGYTLGVMEDAVSPGGTDCFVTTLGETPKTVQFGTTGEDICRAAVWDEKTSSLIVVGETRNAFKGCANTGNSDAFVVKMPMEITDTKP